MKYLFVLNHAHYLRNYGAVALALADRGHELAFAFTAPRIGDPDVFRRVFGGRPGVTLLDPPVRRGWWWAAADPIRALRDYCHYLHPSFDDAPRLVERATRRVPAPFKAIIGRRGASRFRRAFFDRALNYIERSLPPDPGIVAWLRRERPDAVLVSPLIDLGYEQLHILKAAKAIGTPTGHLVASWDNLSNKGRIQITADSCIVWNEFQRVEAVDLHGMEADRILVTGAQLYDHWFTMSAAEDRASYCRGLGLDPARPIILYAGSSPFICPDEVTFVVEWLTRLRSSADPTVAGAQILLRPHPFHVEQWRGADFAALGPLAISPAAGASPIEKPDRQHYFDSLTHAAVVVGINTSVFLEAAIVGRRCLAVRSAMFEESQLGTLHFRHLVTGGLIELAPDFHSHLRGLGDALRGNPADRARVQAFIGAFLRPRGIDRPVVPIVTDAIERIAQAKPAVARAPFLAPLVRTALAPVAALYLRPRYLARRSQRPLPASASPVMSPLSREGRQ